MCARPSDYPRCLKTSTGQDNTLCTQNSLTLPRPWIAPIDLHSHGGFATAVWQVAGHHRRAGGQKTFRTSGMLPCPG